MNCWDLLTGEEKEFVEDYGCFACEDCRIPYLEKKMKPSERDELLIRIDQKVQDSLPRIEDHLEKINGHLDDHSKRIITVEVLQKERNKPSKKALTGYISGGVALVVALWKAFLG